MFAANGQICFSLPQTELTTTMTQPLCPRSFGRQQSFGSMS
jgi:hypothetical protein